MLRLKIETYALNDTRLGRKLIRYLRLRAQLAKDDTVQPLHVRMLARLYKVLQRIETRLFEWDLRRSQAAFIVRGIRLWKSLPRYPTRVVEAVEPQNTPEELAILPVLMAAYERATRYTHDIKPFPPFDPNDGSIARDVATGAIVPYSPPVLPLEVVETLTAKPRKKRKKK
jgi:hypothetical protein